MSKFDFLDKILSKNKLKFDFKKEAKSMFGLVRAFKSPVVLDEELHKELRIKSQKVIML